MYYYNTMGANKFLLVVEVEKTELIRDEYQVHLQNSQFTDWDTRYPNVT